MPTVHVIAGPNGAGKTTFAREFLPRHAATRHFVNADLIAQGMSPFSPDAAAFRAGRLMLDQIRRLATQRVDFGFETTLAGRSHAGLIRDLQQRRFAVHLYFLWVPTPELAIARVQARVAAGGHDVPEATIRRRFERSTRNFLLHYQPLANFWILYDNSEQIPSVVAFGGPEAARIMNEERYREITQHAQS
jgi:predicted ABC-type ATPase